MIGGRERAKHIDIRKHFAHEVIQNQVMRLDGHHPSESARRLLHQAPLISAVPGMPQGDTATQSQLWGRERDLGPPEGSPRTMLHCASSI